MSPISCGGKVFPAAKQSKAISHWQRSQKKPYMNSLIDFFSFQDPNIRFVAIGSVLLTASSAGVCSFTFLAKRPLVGGARDRAVLPGSCLGFVMSGTENPLCLIADAFATGWVSVVLVDFITRRTRIKEDTAI